MFKSKIIKMFMLLISITLFAICINSSTKSLNNIKAEGTPTVWNGTSDTSWYNNTDTTFNIDNAEKFAGVAVLVNGGNTFSGKTLKLTSDLLLNGGGTSNVWTPIGNLTNKFSGTFDGQKHKIEGFVMTSQNDYQGLFGYNEGTIKNFVLDTTNNLITGSDNLGSIAGYNKGTIYNVGSMTIVNSGNADNNLNIGGLVGSNEGTIVNSYFSGYVNGSGRAAIINIGGICGNNLATGVIDNCYNTGTVSGTSDASTPVVNIGGISGTNSHTIINCYTLNTNPIVSSGLTASCATFINNTGALTPEVVDSLNYGVNLRNALNSRINHLDNTYNDLQGWVDNPNVTGYPLLNTGVTLTGNWSDPGNYDTSWYFENPNLLVYNIGTPEQLAGLAVLVNGTDTSGTGYYETKKNSTEQMPHTTKHTELVSFHTKIVNLEKDVDLNGDSMTREWTPIGDYSTGTTTLHGAIPVGSNNQPNTIPADNKVFAGTFSGSDSSINKMYINNPKGDYQGLFGFCFYSVKSVDDTTGIRNQYNNAQNLSVSGEVTGHNYVGGIFGANYRMAFYLDFSGSVTGNTDVGGIAGFTDRAIRNCANHANVTGDKNVGGLNGRGVTGATRNSYNTGNITGRDYVGGITGDNANANVDNCYSIGNVTGTTNVHGISGRGTGVAWCYFLKNDSVNTNLSGATATFSSAENDVQLSKSVNVTIEGRSRSCTTLYQAVTAFYELQKGTVDLVPWVRDDGATQLNQGYPLFGGTLDVVYVRDKPTGYNGNYTGNSVANSVSTLTLAYDKLRPGGTIVICGALTKETITLYHHTDATITSKVTVNGVTTDYRNTANASWTIRYDTTFTGDTKIENINLIPRSNMILFGSGCELWLSTGINVDTTNGVLNLVGGAVQAVVDETNIIVESGKYQILCGGGYYAEYNAVKSVTGDTNITITGGTFGDIYGAGRHADINGTANINIGSATNTALVNSHGLVSSDIIIDGSIVGGAFLPEGSTDAAVASSLLSNVNINGTGYRAASDTASSLPVLTITKSIIGFNMGSSTTGDSNQINITNYGTPDHPMILASIQRANTLLITNSAIKLLGSNDVNDSYSGNAYSLSRIGPHKCELGYHNEGLVMRDSTLICSAPFNMVMRMQSQNMSGTLYEDPNATTITNNYIYMRTGAILELSIIESSSTGSYNVYGEVKGIFVLDVLNSEIAEGSQTKNIYVIAQSSVYESLLGYAAEYTYCNFYSVSLADGNLQEYTDSHYREVAFARTRYDYWEMVPLAYGITEITLLINPTGTTTESAYLPITPNGTIWKFNKLTISSGVSLVEDGATILDANRNDQFKLKIHATTADEWQNNIDFNITGDSNNPQSNYPTTNLISNGNLSRLSFTLSNNTLITREGIAGIVSLEIINPASGDVINYVITIKCSTFNGAPSAVTIRTDFDRKFDLIAAGYTSISIVANSIFSLQITDTYTSSSTTLHRIQTSESLPAGTRITLIDCTTTDSQFYYYVVPNSSPNYIDFSSFLRMGTLTQYIEPSNGPVIGETYILNFDFTRVQNDNHASVGKQIDFKFLIGESVNIQSCFAGMVSIDFIEEQLNSGTITTTIDTQIQVPESSEVEIPYEITYNAIDTVTSIVMVVELEKNNQPFPIPAGTWIEVVDSLGNRYKTYGRGEAVYADMKLPTDLTGKVLVHGLPRIEEQFDIILNLCAIEYDAITQDRIAFPKHGLLTGNAPVEVATRVRLSDTYGFSLEYTTNNENDRVIVVSEAKDITYTFTLKYEASNGHSATFYTDVLKKGNTGFDSYGNPLNENGKWKYFNTNSTENPFVNNSVTFTCNFDANNLPNNTGDLAVYRILFNVVIDGNTFTIPFNVIIVQ